MLKTQAIGNIGKDAVINQVGEKQVINFSVAHTEKYKNKDGVETNKTTWLECAWWKRSDQSTAVAQYLKQGTLVYVEGTPEIDTYVNYQGQTMPKLKLKIDMLQLLNKKETE